MSNLITESSPIYDVPEEVFEHSIFRHIEKKDILILRRTCPHLRDVITPILFRDHFGCKASILENDIPYTFLFSRTIQNLKGIIPQSPKIEEVKEEKTEETAAPSATVDTPQISATNWLETAKLLYSYMFWSQAQPVQSPKTPENVSIDSRLKKQDFELEYAKSANEQLNAIIQELREIDENTQNLMQHVSDRPMLQLLRDRQLRIETLVQEQKALQKSIYLTPFSVEPRIDINLGESEIEFNGEKIKVNIDFCMVSSGVTIFHIRRKDNNKNLGIGSMERVWLSENRDYIAENILTSFSGKLSQCHLKVWDIVDFLGTDVDSGDRPVTSMLVQIAVEIFARENVNGLIINDFGHIGHLLIPRGFYLPGENKSFFDEVKEAKLAGKRYPAIVGNKGNPVFYLDKVECTFPSGKKTQFSRKYKKDEVKEELPNIEDFAIATGEEFLTWEEIIAKNPLLRGKGPILPRYYKKDLAKYEQIEKKAMEKASVSSIIEWI